jgi:ABC-type multidrug transport system ATPase subunit
VGGERFKYYGAGKSTTIRMILTLVRPTAGSIEIFGKDLDRYGSTVLSRVSGIVEKPDFYGYLSAYKNLEILGSMTCPVYDLYNFVLRVHDAPPS